MLGVMTAVALVPLSLLVAILAIDSWVYSDAKLRCERGRPVVFRAGSLVIDTPATWLLGCLVLWIIFFPLYMTNRR